MALVNTKLENQIESVLDQAKTATEETLPIWLKTAEDKADVMIEKKIKAYDEIVNRKLRELKRNIMDETKAETDMNIRHQTTCKGLIGFGEKYSCFKDYLVSFHNSTEKQFMDDNSVLEK